MRSSTQVTYRQASNPDVREYICSQPISEIGYFKFPLPLGGAEEIFPKLGKTGEALAEALMQQGQVEEIERIDFRPFSLTVHKSPNTSWPRVQSLHVVPAFAKALGMDADELQIRSHTVASITDLEVNIETALARA